MQNSRWRVQEKVIILEEGPARAVQRAPLEEGVLVSIEAHGVDAGTDITAGFNRTPKKSRQRCDATTKRPKRIIELTKVDRRATELGRTGIDPAQFYGNTAIGAGDQTIKLLELATEMNRQPAHKPVQFATTNTTTPTTTPTATILPTHRY